MKRRILILSVVALLCVTVLATMAYLTAEETTTNVISTGSVDMDLYEIDGEGNVYGKDTMSGGDDTVSGMHIEGVMPDTEFRKEPIIANIGGNAFYTRAKITITVSTANGYDPELTEGIADYLQISLNETLLSQNPDWAFDGTWYYYKGEVAPGEEVTLFNTVAILPAMPNEYQGCTITLEIESQAVQVKNNEVDKNYNGDYTQIKGWPVAPEV